MAGTPCDRRAVWLPPCPLQFLIHCEGTRFTEKKHQVSMQVAQAKGLPSLKHHLLPRTKGFAITVRGLRDVGKGEPGPAKPPPHPCRAELCPWHRFPSRLGTGRGSGDKGDSCTAGEPGSRPLAAACTRSHTHAHAHAHTRPTLLSTARHRAARPWAQGHPGRPGLSFCLAFFCPPVGTSCLPR